MPRLLGALLLPLVLLSPAAAPGPALKGGPGLTPCWYCGPSCYVRCSWSIYRPTLTERLIPVELIQPTGFGTCGQTPVRARPGWILSDLSSFDGESLVYGVSVRARTSWALPSPVRRSPAHACRVAMAPYAVNLESLSG
jgi:hypothetical protein